MGQRFSWVIVCCLLVSFSHTRGSNIPIDTDSDGQPDYVSVSDWDSDGILEMVDDIQAAIDSLTDTGNKFVVVEAGNYAPPPPGPGSILRVPSNLELVGHGQGVTILNGFDATDITSTGAVLSNADFDNGNEGITVRDLEINGGWGSGDAAGFVHHRMGVYFNKCTNCRVESTTVRDTLHSCLYSKNGREIHFDANTLLQCGNYHGSGGARYPCVYLFANDGLVQENVYVTDNYCDGSGATALATRRESPAATLKNLHFARNTVKNTRLEATYGRRCIWVGGVDGGVYTDNTCINTGSFMYSSEAYYSAGTDAWASRNIHVENLWIVDPQRSHGFEVHGYLENGTFRNVNVENVDVDHDCMVFNNPLKNVTFEGITLENCGRMGIYETLPTGSGPTPEEGVEFQRIVIGAVDGDRLDGFDRPAIKFRGAVRNLSLDDITITDASGDGIVFASDLSDTTLRNIAVTGVGGNGIAVGPDAVIDNVVIFGNTIDGTGRKGLDLQLHATQSSQGLEVSRSTFRDFGRNSPGSATAIGIEISGAVNGLDVNENQLDDIDDQGQYGIVHDVWPLPADTSYLCTNEFAGSFAASEKYLVTGAVSEYQNDEDADGSVDACDCAPADPDTYPGAMELNDGLDNQCSGDNGYGVIDEVSGECGCHNPINKDEFSWPAQTGATSYEVACSNSPCFSSGCLTYTTSGTCWNHDGPVPVETCFHYLVRPLTPNPGSWGQDSARVERTSVCP
jgi:hypothetical protein